MEWESVDTQSQLDALDKAVCWEDASVVEYHGGRGGRRHYPADVNRSGHERLDVHVLVRTPGQPHEFIEFSLVHCDRMGADAFNRLHLRGKVDSLKRIEILSSDGSTLLRAARLLYRWLTTAPTDGTYYWRE